MKEEQVCQECGEPQIVLRSLTGSSKNMQDVEHDEFWLSHKFHPRAPQSVPVDRCGGAPGKPGVMPKGGDRGSTRWKCQGCPDCVPVDEGVEA